MMTSSQRFPRYRRLVLVSRFSLVTESVVGRWELGFVKVFPRHAQSFFEKGAKTLEKLSPVTLSLLQAFKYFGHKSFIQTPLPQLSTLFFLIGIIAIFMGFLAQITMMTYYESQDRKPYLIAYTRNLE